MAELYVRTSDKKNGKDVYLDAQCYKRGDVVAIVDDGHKYGTAEIGNPDHTIIKCPGVDKEKLTAFLVWESGDPFLKKMLQRRGFGLDYTAYLQQPNKKDLLTETEVLALKVTKQPIADPNVLGK